ncbi:MAG: hypothetical protein ACXU82_02190 [Caulobacteraceae bacterium]
MCGFPKGGFDPRDPALFLHDLDPGAGRAGFVRTDRASLSAAPFLDHRWRAAKGADVTAPLAELQAADAEPPTIDFIWHTSYCASTLLATCLDSPGRRLALKEPRALVILAAMKRSGHLAQAGDLAKAVFGLLGRRFEPDERILVKPSDGANTLIAEAAALTRGRMLLLYSDCESFVLSMARRGRAGFTHVRERFRSLAADGHPAGRWPAADLLRLTDLELAALVWRMQMDALEAASLRLGDRALSLDCRALLEHPGAVLPRIDEFFGLGLGRERLGEVVAGPLFRRDAKEPGQPFDVRARDTERAELRAHLGPDLPAVLRAMEDAFSRPPRLARPLATSAEGRSPTVGMDVAVPAA